MIEIGKRIIRPAIRTVSFSDTGLVRSNNEDHLLLDAGLLLFGVADGMGGGEEGENASELVCAEVTMLVRCQPVDFLVRLDAACTAVVEANAAILDYARSQGFAQMGSTASFLLFDPANAARAALCHVGDSRVYRFRSGGMERLTHDHTVAAELARRYGDETMDTRANPLSHVLTRAIGTGGGVSPDWKKLTVESGDRYLVCTDGVHDVVSDARLCELVGAGSLDEAKERLSQEVLDCGAPDNFTFVILDVEPSR